MIKTFIGGTPQELDKKVNDFMLKRGKDLPVRDGGIFIADGKMEYRAMVFFNGVEDELNKNSAKENVESPKPQKTKSEKIGALWIQRDKTISGKLKGKTVVIPEETAENLMTLGVKGKIELKMNDVSVRIIRNKFKTKDKQPDYIMYGKN